MKTTWQPSAAISILKKRAEIISQVRDFFAKRNILEVDTPLLSHASVTDPYVIGIPAVFKESGTPKEKTLYLQASPEYAMKRLLAAGCGAIFQICKAFRQGDLGNFHNPEFTILEWYQPGFDHHLLMDEMDLLLQCILKTLPAERITYGELFKKILSIDPHLAELSELKYCAEKNNISLSSDLIDRNTWLDLLLTHCIEPFIGKERPLFLYDFPITQAALAKIRYTENPPVASRFEVYFKGIELANGFHELQNAKEQRHRFENDLKAREKLGLSNVPIDEYFLAALENGLPDCAGVALGIDRLVMLALGNSSIKEVISFEFERA